MKNRKVQVSYTAHFLLIAVACQRKKCSCSNSVLVFRNHLWSAWCESASCSGRNTKGTDGDQWAVIDPPREGSVLWSELTMKPKGCPRLSSFLAIITKLPGILSTSLHYCIFVAVTWAGTSTPTCLHVCLLNIKSSSLFSLLYVKLFAYCLGACCMFRCSFLGWGNAVSRVTSRHPKFSNADL